MFSDKEMENIFKLLAAILHIGNLRFRGEKNDKILLVRVLSLYLVQELNCTVSTALKLRATKRAA